MAKVISKNSFTPGSAPSGLSAGELAVNVVDKKIFVGNSVGGVVTLHDQQNIVTSVNGITGPVGISAGSNISISSSGKTLTISGNTASVITIGSSNVNGTRYLTFVGGSGATALSIDDVTTPLTYNPSQGNIGAKKGTFTTSSNVITVDSAAPTVTLTDGANVSIFGVDSFAASYALGKFTVSNASGITLTVGSVLGQGLGIECGSGTKYELPLINGKAGQAVIWPSSGSGLTWSDMVTSVNGSTGAITNIARTNVAQTFTQLQDFSAGISSSAGICGGTYMSSGGGYRITSNAIRTLTGTTYTLLSTDDGKIITSSNNSTQIFTVPSGLPVGFNCSVIQLGTGVVGFSAASGVTMNSFAGKTFMAGQHAAVSIIGYSTNIFNLSGGLTT